MPVALTPPAALNALAVLDFVAGGFALLAALASAFLRGPGEVLPAIPVALFCGTIGLLCLGAGLGVWKLRGWGRTVQLVLAWIGLIGFPCSTIISILILTYLHKPGVTILFSGRRAEHLTEGERAELARLPHSSSRTLAIAVALAYLTMIGTVAVIFIRSLLWARASANEAATIGDIRTVISAEAAYRPANHGFYDKLECLSAPWQCIPDYRGPQFLEGVWPDVRYGHQRTFLPGAAADTRQISQAQVSPTSVQSYAYVAAPLEGLPPNETGVRGFCADDRGIICYTLDSTAPAVKDGRCVLQSCRLLE